MSEFGRNVDDKVTQHRSKLYVSVGFDSMFAEAGDVHPSNNPRLVQLLTKIVSKTWIEWISLLVNEINYRISLWRVNWAATSLGAEQTHAHRHPEYWDAGTWVHILHIPSISYLGITHGMILMILQSWCDQIKIPQQAGVVCVDEVCQCCLNKNLAAAVQHASSWNFCIPANSGAMPVLMPCCIECATTRSVQYNTEHELAGNVKEEEGAQENSLCSTNQNRGEECSIATFMFRRVVATKKLKDFQRHFSQWLLLNANTSICKS